VLDPLESLQNCIPFTAMPQSIFQGWNSLRRSRK